MGNGIISACGSSDLGMLAVRPGLQDRGVGRRILDHAESVGRVWGAQVARMTVISVRDSLIAWYEGRGYQRTGETECFPYEDARFGTPLRPDLEFVVLERSLRVVANRRAEFDATGID